jgi:hypothetical protein
MKKHKLLTILLTIALIAAFMPVMAFAADEDSHVHEFGTPEYSWSLKLHKLVRYYDCTAERTCVICGEKETETASVKVLSKDRVTVEPTCTKDGGYLYTVSFQNEAFEDQQYIKTPPVGKKWKALGHDWIVTWDWYEEETAAKATRTCSRCGETSTVDAEVTTEFIDPTWFDPFMTIRTAKAEFDGSVYEDTVQHTVGSGRYEEAEVAFDTFFKDVMAQNDLQFLYNNADEDYTDDPNPVTAAELVVRAEDYAVKYSDCISSAEHVVDNCDLAFKAYEDLSDEQKEAEKEHLESIKIAAETASEFLNDQERKADAEAAHKRADSVIMKEISSEMALTALKNAIEADVTSAKGYTDSSVNAVNSAVDALTAALNGNDYVAIEKACDDLNTAVSNAKLKSNSKIKATAKKTLSAKNSKTTKFAISKALKISGKAGTLTYKKANKSGGSKITVNSKTGKITVKKGLKKGKTYSVRIRVNDSGNGNVKAGSATAIVKIKVK